MTLSVSFLCIYPYMYLDFKMSELGFCLFVFLVGCFFFYLFIMLFLFYLIVLVVLILKNWYADQAVTKDGAHALHSTVVFRCSVHFILDHARSTHMIKIRSIKSDNKKRVIYIMVFNCMWVVSH